MGKGIQSLRGRRLVFAAKEAGAGSLLAVLAGSLEPASGSLCLVSKTAAPYFEGLTLPVHRLGDAAPGIGLIQLESLLRQIAPEALVCGASAGASIEKCAMRIAQMLGIPVHSFVDHYWNLWQRFAHEVTANPWTYQPDYVYVPAKQCRNRIVAQGCPPERVRVFSHPLIDQVPTDMPSRSAAREALGFDPEATVWLFVSEYGFPPSDLWQWEQASDADIEGLLRLLLSHASHARQQQGCPVSVIIKLHPAETRNWQAICADYPTVKIVTLRTFDKAILFAASDVAFGLNSMLLLEATRAGVPAYSCHVSGVGRDTWLSSFRPEVIELGINEARWRQLYTSRAKIVSQYK